MLSDEGAWSSSRHCVNNCYGKDRKPRVQQQWVRQKFIVKNKVYYVNILLIFTYFTPTKKRNCTYCKDLSL